MPANPDTNLTRDLAQHRSATLQIQRYTVELDLGGAKLLQGQARATWQRIEGYGRREVKWLLQAEAGTEVQLRLWSEKAGDDERVVELK